MKTLNHIFKPSNAELVLRFPPYRSPRCSRLVHCCVLALAALTLLDMTSARAVDYHVATAQALQNALTLAASDGANNTIYITNGYYTGNFNYNSSAGYNLAITNEPGGSNMQITLDGGGGGRALSITSSGTSAITIAGITFSRNCGSSIGALRIAGGAGSVILVNGCQFLSPTNTTGMGLELASGLNATITNCTAIGSTVGGGGTGVSISGVTGNVTVQNCTVVTNNDGGITVSGASVIGISGSVFIGNSWLGGANCTASTVTFSNNIFSGNASYNSGGGAFCNDTTLNLLNNTFIGNVGSHGGGAYCTGTATLTGNNFTGNSGDFGGGACFDAAGGATSSTLTGNTFTGNSASSSGGGGGAYSVVPTVTLTNNTFTSNSGGGGNGGGAFFRCSTLTLTGNIFTGNSASGAIGGGAYCSGTVSSVFGNTFQQNNAATGGGVYVLGQTNFLFENLVVNNSQTSSSSQGGGVWVDATSNLFFINNTITGNTAAGSGGGAAFVVTGTVELLNVYNNIIWGNTANGNGGDVWLAGTGKKKLFDFNDADSIYGVWDIALNNIDLSPRFFDPVNGDYHTQTNSPCANAGTNGAPSLPSTDLDGNSRTNSAGLVDMGCYEFNIAATHPADTNASFVITPAEFNAYAAAWQNGQTWTNAPNPIPANYLTRAGYLMTNGGAYYNSGSARPVNWKLIGH